jgi:hypothetical protein
LLIDNSAPKLKLSVELVGSTEQRRKEWRGAAKDELEYIGWNGGHRVFKVCEEID